MSKRQMVLIAGFVIVLLINAANYSLVYAAKDNGVNSIDEALARIIELCEVKEWFSKKVPVKFEVIDEANRYVIRAFVNIEDGGPGHTSVIGWFAVEKENGEAYSINHEIIGGPELSDPKTYLPKPNLKYAVYQQFCDGEQGSYDFYTAHISNGTLVSSTEIVGRKDEKTGLTKHFFGGQDGIYYAYDYALAEKTVWLKNRLHTGQTWAQNGNSWRVLEIGTECDLGFRLFANCLVLEEHFNLVNAHYKKYLAPGYGVVLVIDITSGTVVFKLRNCQAISAKQAQDIVLLNSPNMSKST